MAYAVIFLVGTLIGSIPVAQLIVQWRRGIVLSETGSGSVGANNAYRSTGSKRIAVIVAVLDMLKGVAAVLVGWALATAFGLAESAHQAREIFWPGTLCLLGSLLAHNYNPVLSCSARKVIGGKGFATAAGGFLLLAPLLVFIWLGLLLAGMKGFRLWKGTTSVIPGNVFATIFLPLPAFELYGLLTMLAVTVFAILTLPKHFGQLRELLAGSSQSGEPLTIISEEVVSERSLQESVKPATSSGTGV